MRADPWLLRMSGRRLVPLLMFAFALLLIALRYQHQLQSMSVDVHQQEAARLRERLNIDQARLDLRLGLEDHLFVRRLVGALALHDGIERAFLVDDRRAVMASLSRLDLGRALDDVLAGQALGAALIPMATGEMPRAVDVQSDPEGSVLRAVVPLQSGHRLIVLQDLTRPLALRRAQVHAELAGEAVAVLAVTAVLALMLHLLWFRRARRLADALAGIGAGDLSVRAGLRGRDELAHIGRVADRMAEQLQQDQQRLRHMNALVNRSPAVVIEWANRPGWPVLQVSDAVRQWGYEPDQLLSGELHYNDLFHPDDEPRVNAEVARYFEHGPDSYRQEYRIRQADGTWVWVDDRSVLTRNGDGTVASISGLLLDITAQKASALRESEQARRLRMFYELPFLGMAVSTPADRRFQQVNDHLCDMLGYSREELLGMSWAELTMPEDLRRNAGLFEEMLANRRDGYRVAKRYLRRDGRAVHVEIDVRALRDADGQVQQVFTTVQDVTERKNAEVALRRSRELLLKSQAIGRMGSWMHDLSTGLFEWSPQTYAIHEVDPAQDSLTLETVLALLHEDDVDHVRAVYGEALSSRRPYEIRYRLRMADGRIKHLFVKGEFESEGGVLARGVGMVADETELVDAQAARDRLLAALALERERLHEAQSVARIGSWSVDVRNAQVAWSEHHYNVLGLDPQTVQPGIEAYLGVVHPDDRDRVKAHVEDTAGMRVDEVRWIEHRIVTPGGERYVEERARVERDAQGQLLRIFGTTMDITERVLATQAMTDLKDMLEQAETVSLLGSWAGDAQTQRLNVSPQLFRNLGLEPAERPPTDQQYLDRIHPDDRARVLADMQCVRSGGEPVDLVFRTNPDHGPARWMRRTARRIDRSEQGLMPRYIGTLLDITESVQAEERLRQINLELERRVAERTAQLSQANQELEAFSYTVSHDLKAPLRGIDGYSQLLVEDFGDKLGNEGREFVRRIRHGVELMGELISDLLAYSRMERRDMARDPVALLPLVQQVLEGFEADIRRLGVQVQMDLAPVTLALDREGMAVVLRNLIGNAIKFSRDARPPRLEIGSRREESRFVVWVRDNGVGFDMKYHDRMFGIFQRLHRAEEFPGTGVGLALVAKAVQRMGGRVWADSTPGEGASFYLEFPE